MESRQRGFHRGVVCLLTVTLALTACQPLDVESKANNAKAETQETATDDRPRYTVADVLTRADSLTKADVWVAGYLVGYVPSSNINKATFNATWAVESNVLLSAAPNDTLHFIPIELSRKELRTAVSLLYNPDSLHHAVMFRGNLAIYFGVPGMKSVTAHQWLGEADWMRCEWEVEEEEEIVEQVGFPIQPGTIGVNIPPTPIKGEGSGNDFEPYLPSQIVKADVAAPYKFVYGYVTGYYDGGYHFAADGATDDNVLLSDFPKCEDKQKTIIVCLRDSLFVEAVSLKRHPERINHRIRIGAAIEKNDKKYPCPTMIGRATNDEGLQLYSCDWLDLSE